MKKFKESLPDLKELKKLQQEPCNCEQALVYKQALEDIAKGPLQVPDPIVYFVFIAKQALDKFRKEGEE